MNTAIYLLIIILILILIGAINEHKKVNSYKRLKDCNLTGEYYIEKDNNINKYIVQKKIDEEIWWEIAKEKEIKILFKYRKLWGYSVM